MRDLVELVVAGLAAVAVTLLLAGALLLLSALVPAVRDALGAVHEVYCRIVGIVGGGYGFAGRSRPRRRPPVSSPTSRPGGSRSPASSRSART